MITSQIMKTTIPLEKNTKSRLEKLGNLSSTYDSVVNEVLDHIKSCDTFWGKRE